ncbi:MAG: hypothetical protein H0U80_04860, partial [Solirubrobacterales bacterium]|nr:hypothetical protein [Solirubrobacterales bacterium]
AGTGPGLEGGVDLQDGDAVDGLVMVGADEESLLLPPEVDDEVADEDDEG